MASTFHTGGAQIESLPVNIVGGYKGWHPSGAMWAMENDYGFIQMFYRALPVKFNDGTEGYSLEYFGEVGGGAWVGTNHTDREAFLKRNKFLKVLK